MQSPTVGSYGGAVSYERGTSVARCVVSSDVALRQEEEEGAATEQPLAENGSKSEMNGSNSDGSEMNGSKGSAQEELDLAQAQALGALGLARRRAINQKKPGEV